ncbi:3',5'-cyclic-nucleotide phosphodiesterase [Aquamicrobium sp. LC103]|uniref:MBL fold metallo-hydrolase n=1 Tax=Aquamicrobium sp. LC103 TaxID=1120658 RepID=UPI00063EA24F|nr:3',5'-cyclic-nucleotide phosphodiesterase [Aquamicrobium sp. LC103]TKT74940.1 3',5'-cyclic-nucleotide phosphodiesterase [Aquamicrobium sp. LC103]
MQSLVRAALAACFIFPGAAHAQSGFEVVTLGARGGIEDGNLSAYLIRPLDDERYVTCDAGSIVSGLRAADEKGVFNAVEVPEDSPNDRVGHVLTERIKGYLISHAHLDHFAGVIIASPDDGKKPIYALPSVNERIERNYFNWEAWPNFGDRGKEPMLKKYGYADLRPGKAREIDDTEMSVTAFPLSHAGAESTAFLIESGDAALLCFGDTGPDEVEKSTNIENIWTAVADLARDGRLKGIIIETSYTNEQPDEYLFGHLTPAWLMKSLAGLEAAAGAGALKDMPVVVSHIKHSMKKGETPQERILEQLEEANDLGVRFIIPEQGMKWEFR